MKISNFYQGGSGNINVAARIVAVNSLTTSGTPNSTITSDGVKIGTITIAEDPDVTVAEAEMLGDAFSVLWEEIEASGYIDSSNAKYNQSLRYQYDDSCSAHAAMENSIIELKTGYSSQEELNNWYSIAVDSYYKLQAKFNALKEME